MEQCFTGLPPATSLDVTTYSNSSLGETNPTTFARSGFQVIAPGLKFNCHGRITRWDALLTILSAAFAEISFLHEIHFQVWRPSSTLDGWFDLVGSNIFTTKIESINEITTIGNIVVYTNFPGLEVAGHLNETIVFQPGDVIGWYSSIHFHTFTNGFGVVVKTNGSNSDKNGSNSDLLGTNSSVATSQINVAEMMPLNISGLPLINIEFGEFNLQHVLHECAVTVLMLVICI